VLVAVIRTWMCRCGLRSGNEQIRASSPPDSAESWADEIGELAALMCWKRLRPTAMRIATLEKG
jgi:hypothetical protein